MRKRIFEIIEVSEDNDKYSKIYDTFMMITICVSIFPLAFKNQTGVFNVIDKVSAFIFVVDYILRLVTADYKLEKGVISFAMYPFSFMAIVDLLSILPFVIIVNNSLKLLKIFRFFKSFRYSKNIQMFLNVFRKQRESLTVVCVLAVGYIFISALVIFNVEPETFNNFFDAIYWATVSLTTVGYGDIYAVSMAGKVITMISSVFGIAIVALPAGIITAGYMEELNKDK